MTENRPLILVVNDDADMRNLVASQIAANGYPRPLLAADGDEAISLARQHRPDLIVSDVSMPHVDGFQLCRILRSPIFEGSDKIPVILTSATYRDVIAEEVARNVHAFAYLQQPHESDSLLHLIALALGEIESVPEDRALLRYYGNVLVVDDDPDIRFLLNGLLSRDGWNVSLAADAESAMKALNASHVQLALIDYHLPGTDGLALLDRVRVEHSEVVVIMMTADSREETVVQLIKSGADDYLRKPLILDQVTEACRTALNKYNFLRIHEQFQEKIERLRSVSEYLDLMINLSQEAIFSCDLSGKFKIWNRGAEKLYGYTPDEILGRSMDDVLLTSDSARKVADIVRMIRQRNGSLVESDATRKKSDGSTVSVYATYSAIHNASGEYIGFSVIERDMTPVLALETEKIKSARLRAITQTAVTANDQINTPLGVIMGYSQLLQRKLPSLTAEDEQALDIIQQQALKIKSIMNKLKLMSDPIVKNYSIEGITMLDLNNSR